MRTRILLTTALLLQACEKKEEKPASKITTPAGNGVTYSPAPVTKPGGEPPQRPAPPPLTKEEMDSLDADMDAAVAEGQTLLQPGKEVAAEARTALNTKLNELMKRRGRALQSVTPEQRTELFKRFAPLMELRRKLLMLNIQRPPQQPLPQPAPAPAATPESPPSTPAPAAPSPAPETPPATPAPAAPDANPAPGTPPPPQ